MLKNRELAVKAQEVITESLKKRIPYVDVIPADSGSEYVLQSDIFGYVDSLIRLPGTRLYSNQNKSRNDEHPDLCFEFRSFRGKPQSIETGKETSIAGAHYISTWNRWLAPRFAQADTITYYLPKHNAVYHYNRYYLEILFSKDSTWAHIKSICSRDNDVETYIVFWDPVVFNELYLDTIKAVTCGVTYPEQEE